VTLSALLAEIDGCRACADRLPHGPRPVVQAGTRARLLIIGQAPGSRVHESGRPWSDASGDRLREWTDLSATDFYDPDKVALAPMGFCYPGRGTSGDLPPRPECAPLWHPRLLSALPNVRLTLLVGTYAQARYLPEPRGIDMAARVRRFRAFLPDALPLPHPSWRSTLWMRKNPWFEAEVLPALRAAVAAALAG
jgi:uracil-DNA glycosylase